jgi:hypothetical protein
MEQTKDVKISKLLTTWQVDWPSLWLDPQNNQFVFKLKKIFLKAKQQWQ